VVNRILGVALVIAGLAAPSGAQSFGRSKVHYDDFEFRILSTPHFDIYYYTVEHEAAVDAGRLAERWYTRLSSVLDHSFARRQPIVLYASHAQFTQTNVIPGVLGEGVGGVTEHERGRIVLPFAASLGETDHVLGHELVHAFQRDILRTRAIVQLGIVGLGLVQLRLGVRQRRRQPGLVEPRQHLPSCHLVALTHQHLRHRPTGLEA